MNDVLRAEVGLPLPIDHTLDYLVPRGLALEPGVQVLVPYGKRQLTGVVASLRPLADRRSGPPADKLRAISRRLSQAPALSASLVELLLRAAQDSLSPPGLALAAALPPGATPIPTRAYSLTDAGRRALERNEAPSVLHPLLQALQAKPLKAASLRSRFPKQVGELERLTRLGWIQSEDTTTPGRARVLTQRVYRLAPRTDRSELLASLRRAPKQAALVEQLDPDRALALPASGPLTALIRAGAVICEEQELEREIPMQGVESPAPAPTLTQAQTQAVQAIVTALQANRSQDFLLYGITGSGKTEVYLRAAARALEAKRGVIVLVPEISLTHQLVGRFRARFGDQVAVLHSGLSASERLDQWRRIQTRRHPIAIGARSAIFAPFERIGLIVVDEEHDSSYQSEDGFRYDARELARSLGRLHRCPVVLGSATPDVASAYQASRGELTRLVLPERVARRPLPRVDVIDMERVRRAPGPARLLSQPLQRALAQTVAAGQQAILFLNRRGFATYVYCFHCGEGARCKHCDISLVYHATGGPKRRDRPEQGELRCHYCGYVEEPRLECAGCGKTDGALLGFGTERLEEEVAAMFPRARVARLDRDTSARKGAQERILRAFHAGETDVLIGTQMVAKGHDIPNVTLVGVILADLGLHHPDFRAGERNFQLLTQVAGRAGRGEDPGRVLIQTFLPDHYSIALARTHDYPTFYREELSRRELHGYPPFRFLIRVDLAGPEAAHVEAAASRVSEWIAELSADPAAPTGEMTESVEILGPAPAPLSRIRDQYRWQLLLLGPKAALLACGRQVTRRAREQLRSVQVRVVSAPIQML